MPNTPTIYSSADVSAPVLNATVGIAAGSLNYLLKAILVDGYGSKVAAGWTISNTDTSTYSFLTGSGSSVAHLIVEDLGTSAKVSSAKAITSLEPTVGTLVTIDLIVRKNDGVAANNSWWAMANSRYIYLFIDTAETGFYALSLFAGDLNSVVDNDEYQFVIMAAENSNGLYRNSSFINTVGTNGGTFNLYSTIIKTVISDEPSGSCSIIKPFDTDGLAQPIGGGVKEFYTISPKLLFSSCCVLDGPFKVRGFLPNAYYPWATFPLSDGVIRDIGSFNIIAKNFDTNENGSDGESSLYSKGQIWLDFESSF